MQKWRIVHDERNIRRNYGGEGPQERGIYGETEYNNVDSNVGCEENIWPIALEKQWTRLLC